jgi:hypothetical protein
MTGLVRWLTLMTLAASLLAAYGSVREVALAAHESDVLAERADTAILVLRQATDETAAVLCGSSLAWKITTLGRAPRARHLGSQLVAIVEFFGEQALSL